MSVYFITCRELGMVKIGCALNPFKRMAALQTAFPLELRLEAQEQGAYRREKELHEQFAEHRVRGEWFRISAELEAFLVAAETPRRPRSEAQKRRLFEMHQEPPTERTIRALEELHASIAKRRAELEAAA